MIDSNVMTYLGIANFEQGKEALDKAVSEYKAKSAMSEAKELMDNTKPKATTRKKRGLK